MSRGMCPYNDCDGTEPTCTDRHPRRCPFKSGGIVLPAPSTAWRRRNPDRARAQKQAEYRRRDAEYWRRHREMKRAANRETIERAVNSRQRWDASEDEQALRTDITVPQIAALIGRSIDAVTMRRHTLRRLAGAS